MLALRDHQDEVVDVDSSSSRGSTYSRSSSVTASALAVAGTGNETGILGQVRVEHSSDIRLGNTWHYHGPVTQQVKDALPLRAAREVRSCSSVLHCVRPPVSLN